MYLVDADFTMMANPKHVFQDVELELFDPDFYSTCWTARHNANNTGITEEELQRIGVQCVRCENIVSRTSYIWHKCPEPNSGLRGDPERATDNTDPLEEIEYRLDAVGKGHMLHGLTREEFEGYFSVCIGCDRFLTPDGRKEHVCQKSFMMQSFQYEEEVGDACEADIHCI